MGDKRSVNHIKKVVTSLKKNGDREADGVGADSKSKEEEREEVG